MGELANHHPPSRKRTTSQRPNLARRCPGPGLATAGDLETAIRALGGPVKLQQILADLPLRTTALHPVRLRRGLGWYAYLCKKTVLRMFRWEISI